MDYQPMDQTAPQALEPMNEQGSPAAIGYIIGLVVIIALGLWYVYGQPAAVINDVNPSVAEQSQEVPLSSGDTTSDIANDLNQTPDSSAALNADVTASVQEVQSL